MQYQELDENCWAMLRYLAGRGAGDVAYSSMGSRQGLRRVVSTCRLLHKRGLVNVYSAEYPAHQRRVFITEAGDAALAYGREKGYVT